MQVADKVAIVTGAIGGIGMATVQCLLQNNVKYVALMDLHESDDSAVIESLQALERQFDSQRFGYYFCNVTNVQQFTKCYEAITALAGYVDILINNAGVGCDKNIDLSIDVNFKAVIHCSMTALNYMDISKSTRGGVIVSVSSILGLINRPLSPLYCATKHAIVSFVRSMKEHNKKFGVRFVCVCPNATKTNMMSTDKLKDALFDFVDPALMKQHASMYLQKPDTVATAILQIIEKGEEGAVWVSQSDLPGFPLEEQDLQKSGIIA